MLQLSANSLLDVIEISTQSRMFSMSLLPFFILKQFHIVSIKNIGHNCGVYK